MLLTVFQNLLFDPTVMVYGAGWQIIQDHGKDGGQHGNKAVSGHGFAVVKGILEHGPDGTFLPGVVPEGCLQGRGGHFRDFTHEHMGVYDQQNAVALTGLLGVAVDHIGACDKYTTGRNSVSGTVNNGIIGPFQHEDNFHLLMEVGVKIMLTMSAEFDLLMYFTSKFLHFRPPCHKLA